MWVEYGLDPVAFWSTAPQEMKIILNACQRREIKGYNLNMSLAWHIAALQRYERLPRLQRLLRKSIESKPRMTWQEQMIIMDQWVNATRHLKQR